MGPRRCITNEQRRARLVTRHHLGRTGASVEAVAGDLVAVHSSDPATPYLAMWGRLPAFSVGDLDRALYCDRSLQRLHGMRRTLFVVRHHDAAVVQAACGRDVARTERRKLERWVSEALDGVDPQPWLDGVARATLEVLADGRPWRTQELTAAVEGFSLRITVGSGRWTAQTPVSSRLLFLLAMEGHIVRARPAGSWLSSQYHWVAADAWFGQGRGNNGGSFDPSEARAELARGWLGTHGPASARDLQWWTGWTGRRTQTALAAVEAVEVDLEGAQVGWALPDDADPVVEAPHGVALLPALDPTVMGWRDRDWYLGGHVSRLFDRNGNAGPTVWVDGRVVGGWAQRPDGEVVTALLEDVGSEAAERVNELAEELTAWCNGVAPIPRFRTPLERELSGR